MAPKDRSTPGSRALEIAQCSFQFVLSRALAMRPAFDLRLSDCKSAWFRRVAFVSRVSLAMRPLGIEKKKKVPASGD
jgi:hypothetical protein